MVKMPRRTKEERRRINRSGQANSSKYSSVNDQGWFLEKVEIRLLIIDILDKCLKYFMLFQCECLTQAKPLPRNRSQLDLVDSGEVLANTT